MKKITLFCFFALLSFINNAQLLDTYNFSVINENYVNLTNSISLNNGMYWDDPEYTIPIGFDFEIGGKTISTLYISFGDAIISSEYDSTDDLAMLSILSPEVDLEDNGNENNSLSNISYITEGSIGDRIFKLEWDNAGFFAEPSSEYVNFQLWLYEDDYKVEYRYGASNITNPAIQFEEDGGPYIFLLPSYNDNDFNETLNKPAYFLSGDPNNPTVTEVLPGDENLFEGEPLTSMPDSGTVYRFTPNETMSVDENSLKSFEIYPNPSEDFIAINTNFEFLDYTIYDRLGKRIAKGELKDKIEISNLASGVYFLELNNGSSKEIEKFIKK